MVGFGRPPFFFNLTNAGDTLILTCGGIEVDRVTYVDGEGTRPSARAASISLDARNDSDLNDEGGVGASTSISA